MKNFITIILLSAVLTVCTVGVYKFNDALPTMNGLFQYVGYAIYIILFIISFSTLLNIIFSICSGGIITKITTIFIAVGVGIEVSLIIAKFQQFLAMV